jgi:uroporphyrinogen decarboxylase
MYYMVGGSSKKNQDVASSWLRDYPAESSALLQLLTSIVVEYTSAQVRAGADLIQIFEAMGDYISESDFHQWALPSLVEIAKSLKSRHPSTPLLVFPRGAPYAIAALARAGYDVVTLGTAADRLESRATLAHAHAAGDGGAAARVQGNFDVKLLQLGSSTSSSSLSEAKQAVRVATRQMLSELGPQNLIANLGEGLTGAEDPELVAEFVKSVHEISEEMIVT